MRALAIAVAATVVALLPAAAAAQQARSNIGTLTCTVAGAEAGAVAATGEDRAMSCLFKPAKGGAEQTYGGTIRKVGAGQLPAAKLVMIWVVQGPDGAEMSPGALQQTYVGQPVEPGANRAPLTILSGQTDKRIVLQSSTPTSAPTGVPAVTILDLELKSVPA